MEINIWVVLGIMGSIILALGLLAYFGNVLGRTMNAILPGTGDFFISTGNIFLFICIVVVFIVVVVFIYLATQQSSMY
ncbi:MAG: hypothetical protein QXS48_00615 [Candidatus Aenigmatarchaeota archaeon]